MPFLLLNIYFKKGLTIISWTKTGDGRGSARHPCRFSRLVPVRSAGRGYDGGEYASPLPGQQGTVNECAELFIGQRCRFGQDTFNVPCACAETPSPCFPLQSLVLVEKQIPPVFELLDFLLRLGHFLRFCFAHVWLLPSDFDFRAAVAA